MMFTVGSMLASATMHQPEHMRPNLVLKTDGDPGTLTVRNDGDSAIEVDRKLGIEKKDGDNWTPIIADFDLIADCSEMKKPAQHVRIPAKQSVVVVRWTGYSCSGQCRRGCRANIAYAPGVFRFVATLPGVKQHVFSDAFELSATK